MEGSKVAAPEREEKSLYVVQPFKCVPVGERSEVGLVAQGVESQLKQVFVPVSKKRRRRDGRESQEPARQSARRTRRTSFSFPPSASSSSSSSSGSHSDQSEYNVSDYNPEEGEEIVEDQPVSSDEMRDDEMMLSGSDELKHSDVSGSEAYGNIAVIDAFKRVSPGARSYVVPIVVTSKEALHPLDGDDTTSATMSLPSADDQETEQQSAKEEEEEADTTMLDALALAVEQLVSADAHKAKRRAKKPKVVVAQNKGSPISTWYSGYEVACGMAYIHSTVRKDFVQPDPLYEVASERWRRVSWTPDMLPQFTIQDSLKGSIEYLKYAARRVGNLHDPPANVQRTVMDQFQEYERILSNISDMKQWRAQNGQAAGDARRRRKGTKKPKMESPLIFSPRIDLNGLGSPSQAMVHGMLRRSTAVVEGDPAARTDVRWGSMYQATMPPKKEDSSAVDEERERRLGGTLIAASGTIPPPKRQNIDGPMRMNREERAEKIMEESEKLINAAGSLADMLGLKKMGAHMVNALTSEEQEAFGNGMTKHGRNFKRIKDEFLPHVSCRVMAAYYYDVWKLQLIPAAVKWYQERDEERARQEETLRDEKARKVEIKDASSKRRLVKDSITWIKSAARSPSGTNFNRQIIQDRLQRAKSCRKASHQDA